MYVCVKQFRCYRLRPFAEPTRRPVGPVALGIRSKELRHTGTLIRADKEEQICRIFKNFQRLCHVLSIRRVYKYRATCKRMSLRVQLALSNKGGDKSADLGSDALFIVRSRNFLNVLSCVRVVPQHIHVHAV